MLGRSFVLLMATGCFLFLDNLLPHVANLGLAEKSVQMLMLDAFVPPPGFGEFTQSAVVLELASLIPAFFPTVDVSSLSEEPLAAIGSTDVVASSEGDGLSSTDSVVHRDVADSDCATTDSDLLSCPRAAQLFDSLFQCILGSATPFGKFVQKFVKGQVRTKAGRWRDLLPFPLFASSDLRWKTKADKVTAEAVTRGLQLCVAGLNWLGGHSYTRCLPATLHKPHHHALDHLLDNMCLVFRGLECEDRTVCVDGAFLRMARGNIAHKFPDLAADRVGIPKFCATLDPLPFMQDEHANTIQDSSCMFPGGVSALPARTHYSGPSLHEYITLTVRELRAGRLGLSRSALCSADVFAVGKRDSDKQRVVWNGSRISEVCDRPPMPPMLANPHALGDLEASADRPLWASARDGQSWFDQLLLPDSLKQYMGRPCICLQDLLGWQSPDDGSLTLNELQTFVQDDGGALVDTDVVTPISLCWPMGFAWSSYAAQSTMVASVLKANFESNQFLVDEGALPTPNMPTVAVATDDVTAFVRASVSEVDAWRVAGVSPLDSLDEAWGAIGIAGQDSKRYDLLSSATVLGASLLNGTHLGPRFSTVWSLIEAIVDLSSFCQCSPKDYSSILGSTQWQNLLNRPLFSCLHVAYAFARTQPLDKVISLWPNALAELQLNCCLSALWIGDLCRPWASRVFATDASPSFGFGVCQAKLDPHLVREAASVAGRGPHHFHLRNRIGDESDKPRAGTRHVLPLHWGDFKVVLSSRARRKGHAGQLEAEGAFLALRRAARDVKSHGVRQLILMDAIAVLSALQKGRSSAPTLRSCIRRCSVLLLAGNIRARFGYIPTAWNPADPPSRGKRADTAICRHRRISSRSSSIETKFHKTTHAGKCIKKMGHTQSLSGSRGSSSFS